MRLKTSVSTSVKAATLVLHIHRYNEITIPVAVEYYVLDCIWKSKGSGKKCTHEEFK